MPRMSPAPRTPTDAEHEAEVAKQAEIADLVETDAVPADAVPDNPEADAAPVTEEAPKVTLRSIPDAVDEYPLSVSVVGTEDGKELVFDSADATIEVAPQVAEQVTYLPNVEVAS